MHAHAGLARHGTVPLVLGLHYLRNWAQDERDQIDDPRTPFIDEANRPDPHMTVLGADFRMIDNYLGNFAAAVSYAYAYYAANGSADPYDRRRCIRAYAKRAYAFYRPHHVDRGMAMIFKAVGLDPQGKLQRAAASLAWRFIDYRTKALTKQAA